MNNEALLSPLYGAALLYASNLHSRQIRKGTTIPYISHLIAVSSLVLEYGGTETEAIAALLHDSLEDCGPQHEAPIRRLFGDTVAGIILSCTDGTPDTNGHKAPWRERKEHYLQHLATTDDSARLVSACDKLHNIRCISRDYREQGESVFTRFKAGQDGTFWYYRALTDTFLQFKTPPARELDRELLDLEATLRAALKGTGLGKAAGQAASPDTSAT